MIICLLVDEDVVMYQFAAGLLTHSELKKSKSCKNLNFTYKRYETLFNIRYILTISIN